MEGKVYRLEDEDGFFYIGSTTKQYLSQRLAGHSYDSKTKPDKSPYNHFNQKGFDKVCISCISTHTISSLQELKYIERTEIEKHLTNPKCLNIRIPIYTEEERLQRDRQRALQQYHKNKEKRSEYARQYYQDTIEKQKERNKEYHQQNREKILERMKINRERRKLKNQDQSCTSE